jgi:hypothetical protein
VLTREGVQLLQRPEDSEEWEVTETLTENGVKEATIVRWSLNGRFLISAHTNGNIFLWDVEEGESLDRFSSALRLVNRVQAPTYLSCYFDFLASERE